MKRLLAALALVLFCAVPATALAAPQSSFSAARSLVVASSSPGNAYAAGTTVTIAAPTAQDLTATGGSVILAAPVWSDALLVGGTVESRGAVGGDLRVFGGSVSIDETVGGDLVALAASISDSAPAKGSTFLIAANASLTGGAGGPVTIYANNAALAGDFKGNVRVVASGRVSIAEGTRIEGSLTYDAPEEVRIPDSAVIVGGVHYTSASYLPPVGAVRTLAFASIGIFLLARIMGALILAGLIAGLFPRLASAVVSQVTGEGRMRSVLLTALLGFAALVATPVLLFLLALTFIGFGIAILIFVAYWLLIIMAFIYAGILVGALIAERLEHRSIVLWRDGVVGMFVLCLIALVPYLGMLTVAFLMAFAAGALLLLFFRFAFPHEEETIDLL